MMPGVLRRPGRPSGFAIAFSLLVTLAVLLLSHGALVLATQHVRTASVRARWSLDRLEVRASVLRALADSLPDSAWSAPVGTTVTGRTPPGSASALLLRRLGASLWTIEARSRRPGARVRTALPVWSLDPTSTGGVGVPSSGTSTGDWRVGPLTATRVAGRLRTLPDAVLAPSPMVVAGRCAVSAPGNWGDPAPGSACRDHRVAWVLNPGARVEGGVGQGLLVVPGDVTLSGVVFEGLVVATGRVRIETGTSVRGWVHGDLGVVIDPGAVMTPDDARVRVALLHARLRPPWPVRPVRWLDPPP